MAKQSNAIKARALHPGDKIGIIAPASNIQQEMLEKGTAGLRQLGYEPVYLPSILERELYFAGSVERRVHELEEMLERSDVAALICARGGYGTNYLLGRLDFKKFAQHPKIIMGYSDNTTLLTVVSDRAGLVTFHGPMVAKDFASADGVDVASWQNAVGGAARWELPMDSVQVLRAGQAHGRLYGGCLSLLVASLGTPYEIQSDETILFIEDIGAKPYQVDRMLMQLQLAGKLQRVRGFVFGEMLDCVQPNGQDYSLQQVIMRVLENYAVPIVYGVKSGHVSRANITLPIGVKAELVASNSGKITILESAVRTG